MPTPEDRVDVVVIGAGIIGASCAYHLTARGRRVAVVEALEAPAQGSTGRSFASLRGQWRDALNIVLSWESIRTYRDFESRYGVDVGYRPSGYLLLVPDGQWEEHLAGLELQRSLGVPVTAVDLADAAARTPFEPARLRGATWGPADGVVDPHLVTVTYLAMARERGAGVRLRAPVGAVEPAGAGWAVTTPAGSIRADAVVDAAGGWAGEVAALAGLKVPVYHLRRTIYASAPVYPDRRLPMTIDVGTGFYVRSEGPRVLFGYANPGQAPGYDNTVDWDWLEPALTVGVERFPWLADLPIDRAACWAGTYDMTPDHRPFLGAMPGAPGWFNACGFSGHGVMQAPMVGQLVAEEIVDGGTHTVDIDPLRIDRLRGPAAAAPELLF